MDKSIDPAFAIIHQLRTQTDVMRYSSKNRAGEGQQPKKNLLTALHDAGHAISTLDTPGKETAEQVIDWLLHETRSRKAINSVHHKTDDICRFLSLINDQSLIERLKSDTIENLCPPDMKECAQRRYFSSLRSLYRFIAGVVDWSDLPTGLKGL